MTIEFPDIVEIFADEITEVEDYLTFLDDIARSVTDGEKLLAAESLAARRTLILTRALGILNAAWLAYEAWELLDSLSLEAKRLAKNKEARKVKTALCVMRAASVLEKHRAALHQGKFAGKNMETRDTVKRYRRKFQSRA